MIEIPSADFSRVAGAVESLHAGHAIVGSVLEGHMPARVFASSDGRCAFVHHNGFCVLAGAQADEGFARGCLEWLADGAGQDFFVLYPGHECWEPLLDSLVRAPIRKFQRVAFRLDPAAFRARSAQAALPAPYRLVPMDLDLLRQVREKAYPWAAAMWKSAEYFEEHGLGYCVLADGQVASLCYSGFASGRHHEIDILTLPPFRRMGFGRAVAGAFIDECLRRGLQPGWDCFQANRGSYELACGLGFKPTLEFPVYAWQRGRDAA